MSDEIKRIPGTDFAMDRDCAVIRVVPSGYSPIGYCRRPVMKSATIYYVLPLTNVSHSGRRKTMVKPVTRLYRELFGEELVIDNKKRFMQQLQDQAEISNLKLREERTCKPKLPPTQEPKLAPTDRYRHRLGSRFNVLKNLDDFAAAVGKPAIGSQETTMADYCPLG
ncbi:hypothetical protein [Maridesulfovibrio sp.]|uniref:hypothetical protein n=1 Tax=Maridesulfovibrio sp. TaxID=2795000 RepID=UPI0029C9C9B1|nr:hypothetical protein [Maridesulfovibrio sp.]